MSSEEDDFVPLKRATNEQLIQELRARQLLNGVASAIRSSLQETGGALGACSAEVPSTDKPDGNASSDGVRGDRVSTDSFPLRTHTPPQWDYERSSTPTPMGQLGWAGRMLGLETPPRRTAVDDSALTAPPRVRVHDERGDTPSPIVGDHRQRRLSEGVRERASEPVRTSEMAVGYSRMLSPTNERGRLLSAGSDPWPPPAQDHQGSPRNPSQVPLTRMWTDEDSDKHYKVGFERFVARQLGRWGNVVSRRPCTVAIWTVIFHVALAAGILSADFHSDSHELYVGQRTPIAEEGRRIDRDFGPQPSPLMLIVTATDPEESLLSEEWMTTLFDLHDAIYDLAVPIPVSMAPGRGHDHSWGTNVTFEDLCARRYVHMRGKAECIVVSPLQVWVYSRHQLESDHDVVGSLSNAYRDHLIDLGGSHIRAPVAGTVSGVQALMVSYYLDIALPAFHDGRAELWDRSARDAADEFLANHPEMRLSYWSQHFNEEESSKFVHDDAPLMGAAFGVVLIYVSLSLSQWSCDPHRSRYMLGSTALVCSGLALLSGMGMAAMLRVPLTPLSPLVCFTLLGVSVDDMIIITDAFDRLAALDPFVEPGAFAMGGALHEIGGAITMTSFTTISTFLTGWTVDLPVYSYFCGSASACVLMLYQIQMTLYSALLVLDARRRFRLRQLSAVGEVRDAPKTSPDDTVNGKNPATPATPPPPPRRVPPTLVSVDGDELTSARSGRVPSPESSLAPGPPPTPPRRLSAPRVGAPPREEATPACTPSTHGFVTGLGRLLSRRSVRYGVLAAYGAIVATALAVAPTVKVGLPQRQTVADNSEIQLFLDDVDSNWRGDVPTTVHLVFRNTNLSNVDEVEAVQRVVDRTLRLDFVQRTQVDWIERFGQWCACMRGLAGDLDDIDSALPPPAGCSVAEFLEDGEVHDTCGRRPDRGRRSQRCEDLNEGFMAMNGGHSCTSAVSHCEKGTLGWRTVQRYCPVTCGVCLPGASRDGEDEPEPEPMADANGTKKEHNPMDFYGPAKHRRVRHIAVPFSAIGGRDLAQDVKMASPEDCTNGTSPCVLSAHRVLIVALVPQIYYDAYWRWLAMEEIFREEGVDGHVYQVKYEFAIADYHMMLLSVRNLCTAAPVIGLCTCLFLHPVIAIMAVLAVVSIDVILFGLMAATGTPLNVITLLSLLIALGLAIDYACHFGHAYQHAPQPTR